MRLPRLRFSVRWLMIVVAISGILFRLGSTAIRVLQAPDDKITHIIQNQETGALSIEGHSMTRSFWPQYRRALLGQSSSGAGICPCMVNHDPRKHELASAPRYEDLQARFQKASILYQKASEHRLSMNSLAASIAWDEKRVKDLDEKVKELASQGRILHGAEGVRNAFLKSIATNRKSLREHERLFHFYDAAARSPTILTDPEPVEPKAPDGL